MRLPAGSGNNVEIRKHQGRPAKLPFLMFLILRSMIDRDGGMISQSGNDPNPPDALIKLAEMHTGRESLIGNTEKLFAVGGEKEVIQRRAVRRPAHPGAP